MAYTPDPTDASQPVGSVPAGTADEEFRALKGYIKTLVVAAINAGPDVRQTASIGSQDGNGDANFLSAGTGLALNLAATTDALCLTYAEGTNSTGGLNYSEAISADVVGVMSALAPSNLSYITKIFGGAWGKTLAPCQYGKVFDRAAQLLVRWPGANNAVVTTEDFGNTVTFGGAAKISTATQILGLNTLLLTGAAGVNATIPFTAPGDSSWELFGSFRATSLATPVFINIANAASYGLQLNVTAGGLFNLYLSSTGTSWDIAAPAAGTTVLAINTTYFYRLTFDVVASTYRLYLSNNGAAEVQDITLTSALRMCTTSTIFLGTSSAGLSGFVGNIGYFGIRKWASATSAAAVGPTVAPVVGDVATPFFSIPQMKMYDVTAASVAAGTNPAMVSSKKLYLAETITSGAAVVSVTNYAYKGKYTGFKTGLAIASSYTLAHNINAADLKITKFLENTVAQTGFVPGDRVYNSDDGNGGTGANWYGLLVTTNRKSIKFTTGSDGIGIINGNTGAPSPTYVITSWKAGVILSRDW